MSVYISNLPEYTGNTYNGYIVWNDSGETTTYKTKYQPQLIPGTGTNSYRTPTQTASGLRSIAIGEGASASGEDSVSIGNGNNIPTGYRSVSIGRHPYPLGDSNVIMGSGAYCYGNNTILIGHETSANSNGIVIGSNTSRAGGQYAITIGHSCDQNNSWYSTILGYNNQIGLAPNFLGSQYSVVIGTNHNVETDSGYYYNNILGGFGNYITGTTSGATLIGLNNYTEPLLNDLTYTNNYHALRTYSTEVQAVSSGTTFTCNLNNGGKSQFYLTANTTIDITNVRDGQSFIIKTQTDGNYTITWTATGYTFVFEGGLKDPGNTTIDLFVFEVFGSVIYGNRRHNYS